MVYDVEEIAGSVEYMGILGFSFEEKVASFIKKQMKGWALEKKINTTIVKNMHNEYMALMVRGFAPVAFTTPPDQSGTGGDFALSSIDLADELINTTGVDGSIVMYFLKALYVLSRDGKIPISKVDPKGFQASTALRKSLPSEKGVVDALKTVAGPSKALLVIAGMGVAAYLLSQIKPFINKK